MDELKKDLALAQDEVDTVTSSLRKLQRINEDLVEQLESANSQLERLKDRYKILILMLNFYFFECLRYKNIIIIYSSETCTPDVVAETMDEKCCEDNENVTEPL